MRLTDASGKVRPHWGSRVVEVVSPFLEARSHQVSVSSCLKDLGPIVWDEYGIEGEVEDDE
eukprot:6351907-Karenia_brevis.AAC.1